MNTGQQPRSKFLKAVLASEVELYLGLCFTSEVIVHHFTDTKDFFQVEYEVRTDDTIKFGRLRFDNKLFD